MEPKYLQSEELVPLSFKESYSIIGGADEGWDYKLAEYIGVGAGYSAKKFLKMLKFLSANLYSMSSNPKLLYQ